MAAPFRITKGTRSITSNEGFKEYLERLLKMIPAEVVGLYIIGSGFVPQDQRLGLAIWSSICLLCVFVVRIYGTADGPDKPAQPVPVVISAVAFVIWLYSMGGPFAKYGVHIPWIGSLAVLLWSFVVPIFYKGPSGV